MKYKGTGVVTGADFKQVKWVGRTKSGQAVTITLDKAINMGNISWTFAEKDDVVDAVEMTAVYTNTNESSTDTAEPWSVEVNGAAVTGANSIMLGAGLFYIGDSKVALTRGGGSFTVEREFREIQADDDRGPVEGRIEMTSSRAKLKMNVLTILEKVTDLYAAVTTED